MRSPKQTVYSFVELTKKIISWQFMAYVVWHQTVSFNSISYEINLSNLRSGLNFTILSFDHISRCLDSVSKVPSLLSHSPTAWYTVTLSLAATGTLISSLLCWKLLEVLLPQSYPVVPETPSDTEKTPSTFAPTWLDTVRLLLPPWVLVLADVIPCVTVTFKLRSKKRDKRWAQFSISDNSL